MAECKTGSESCVMNNQQLEYFHKLLIWQRRQATEDLRAGRTTALEADDSEEDIGEMSELDLNRLAALELATRQSHLIQDIDDALGRIENGTYGQCVRCGKPLYKERLKVIPTAKYGPKCQATIEAAQRIETPTI